MSFPESTPSSVRRSQQHYLQRISFLGISLWRSLEQCVENGMATAIELVYPSHQYGNMLTVVLESLPSLCRSACSEGLLALKHFYPVACYHMVSIAFRSESRKHFLR